MDVVPFRLLGISCFYSSSELCVLVNENRVLVDDFVVALPVLIHDLRTFSAGLFLAVYLLSFLNAHVLGSLLRDCSTWGRLRFVT